MESASANRLNTLKDKKERTEKAIVTSFLVHLALMVVELLTMLIILSMADLTNIVRTIFVLVVGFLVAVLLYLTSVSFVDRVSEEMLSFWHCIKIVLDHKQTIKKPKKDLNFIGYTNFDTKGEQYLDEIIGDEDDVNYEPKKNKVNKFR